MAVVTIIIIIRKNYLKLRFSRTRRQKQIPFFLFTNTKSKEREVKGSESKGREEALGSCC